MKKIVVIAAILLIAGGAAAFGVATHQTSSPPVPVPSPSAVTSRSPSPTPVTFVASPVIPKTLIVPKLGIQATVEQVGQDKEGRMAVPKDWKNVGWYEYGPHLGEVGSVVIAGHLDTPTGGASVFYHLDELTKGDEIVVKGNDDKFYTYVVESKADYEDATFPVSEVFEKNDAKRLNLITCSGTFNKNQRNYSHRLVVYSKLKE